MSIEMQQKLFGDVPTVVNANESHMACLLLLDTSGSMACDDITPTPIDELNAAINKFKAEVCEDPKTRDVLEVAIVAFNSHCEVVQEFCPIEFMKPVYLQANGGTYMAPAIQTAIDMIDTRVRFYWRSGTEPYKPWIVMITDGEPLDKEEDFSAAVQRVHQMEEDGKLSFRSLGVGEYNSKVLHQLSGKKVMKLSGYDFTSFFDWVNKSMRAVSVSSPGERPEAIPLTENVDKDTSDWD